MRSTAPRSLANPAREGRSRRRLAAWLGGWAAALCLASTASAEGPIRLHPENPHYFLFRGVPTVLITSGEHYGAVLNRDFDYPRYLDVLEGHGFNLTRTFAGTYREVPGSFGIIGNTLAPAPGRFLCPWARSATPGASDGGSKFDLSRWDPDYFDRLRDFVAEAGRRGIVVELVLFCTMYDEATWRASPMNARNNVNGVGAVGRHEVYSGKGRNLLAAQEAMVREIVTRLNGFDNLYFEVCNEPFERPGLTREWSDRIIATIAETEAVLPSRHLIAQGVAHGAARATDLDPRVSVLNFHAAMPEDAGQNIHLGRVLADDETGGTDRSDRRYRTEAWRFLLAGGAVFDHLDFSFTTDRADGMAVPLPPGTPGGGGPGIRKQLAVLKGFIEGFDFVAMTPDDGSVTVRRPREPPAVGPGDAGVSVGALVGAGRAYAIYLSGGAGAELGIDLSSGDYQAEWVDPKTGEVVQAEDFAHAGGERALVSPPYSEDIALRVRRSGADRGR